MHPVVAKFLSVFHEDFDSSDIDRKLEAFEELQHTCTTEQLDDLVTALQHPKNDFSVRELLAEPIAGLGGSAYLSVLFEAAKKNADEGHDNDGLNHSLVEIAELDPKSCRANLKALLQDPTFEHGTMPDGCWRFVDQTTTDAVLDGVNL